MVGVLFPPFALAPLLGQRMHSLRSLKAIQLFKRLIRGRFANKDKVRSRCERMFAQQLAAAEIVAK